MSRFFLNAISIFETNNRIATLTTQIYDLLWGKNRISIYGPNLCEGVRYCHMLCGGSHFLSRSFFKSGDPYFPNKYGYEEILPSLRVADAGYINAFAEKLCVIHNPLVNKWDYNISANEEILIKEIALPCLMKIKYYPLVVAPLVKIAYRVRCRKYLNNHV